MSYGTFHGDFQIATFNRIVKYLQADPYLASLLSGRIYPQHISTIENPIYPCVTISRQGAGPDSGFAALDKANLYVDVWSKVGVPDLYSIYASKDPVTFKMLGIRALLSCGKSGEPKGFDFPEATVNLCREVYLVDNLWDSKTRSFHLAARYELQVAAKNVTATQ